MKQVKIVEKNEVYRIAYSDFQHFISPKEFFNNPPPTIQLEYGKIYDLLEKLNIDEHYTILKLRINNIIYWSYAQFEIFDKETKQQDGIVSIKAQVKENKLGKVTFIVG